MLNRRHLCAALAATLCLPSLVSAQSYPTRPIRLIVPYAAGGGTDTIARVVAQAMSEKLGQTIVVENIATGAGNVATLAAAAAAPDGYTILMANQGPIAVNPSLMKSLKIDTLKTFDAVTLIASAPLVVVVPASSPIKTFSDLVEAARKNPGKLTYGSAGIGSASHLATILLNVVANLDTLHVPYRGAGPAIIDLLGGQTQFMVTTIPSVTGMVGTGQLRALAVTSERRTPFLKDVATVAESGLSDYQASAWYGLVVPAGTSPAIIDTLRKATVAALGTERVRSRLDADGAQPVGNSPEEFSAFIKAEYARWKDIIAKSKIEIL